MTRTKTDCAIVFADVCGSTRLYEELGDTAARELIGYIIGQMSEIVGAHSGRVVKTIGDEIMCAFPDATSAIEAAMAMQASISSDTSQGRPIAIRIGAQFGQTIEESDGDVFGDAVNIAARMVGIAKAGQIIITEETAAILRVDLREESREIDRTYIKGKSHEIGVHEVVWQREELTRLASDTAPLPQGSAKKILLLNWRTHTIEVTESSGPVTLGRGDQADFTVKENLASREHARIEYRRGKFVLVDQSTNGTYVRSDSADEIFIKRENTILMGSGVFSLGRSTKADEAELIQYSEA